MILDKYSMGIGDRFGQQGNAQLQAFLDAKALGINITPVWNKSHREHCIVKTSPLDTRKEANEAVKNLEWSGPYYVDADHVGFANLDHFIDSCDFFTIDVADSIGKPPDETDLSEFLRKCRPYIGRLSIPGISEPFIIDQHDIASLGCKYLTAIKEAARICAHIEKCRGSGKSIIEISMDESDTPQTALDLFFILAAIAFEKLPVQTIAPRFIGQFNKGIDYIGDVAAFAYEFDSFLSIISFAIAEFGMLSNLKLSVHSGSDKFSLYGAISSALIKHNGGIHLKTAGATWLEELGGLAVAGGEGLDIAKEIYRQALTRFDELCAPYATVINIDSTRLPRLEDVEEWSGSEYTTVLDHNIACPVYNPHFRQLLHVSYKNAATMGERFYKALHDHREIIANRVRTNLLNRHILPIFQPLAPNCNTIRNS